MRHLTKVDDFTKNDCNEIFKLASKFEKGGNFKNLCAGKILKIAFWLESKRTRGSLEKAMKDLGGNSKSFYGTTDASNEDIITTLRSSVRDSHVMAVRYWNPDLNLSAIAHDFPIPLINAMAADEHAVGAFWFYYSLSKRFDLSTIKIGVYGLAGVSQPLRAIIRLLGKFGATFYEDTIISEFETPYEIIERVKTNGGDVIKSRLNDDILRKIDVLIICEGGQTETLDRNLMKKYLSLFKTVTMNEISKMREDAIVITVTPRRLEDGRDTVNEEVARDKRFFDDMLMNETVFVHMAVIHYLLNYA